MNIEMHLIKGLIGYSIQNLILLFFPGNSNSETGQRNRRS